MDKVPGAVWIVLVLVILYALFKKSAGTATALNTSIRQTYTPTTAVSAVVTSTAPALGSFLSNLFKGGGSTIAGGASSQSDTITGYDYGGSCDGPFCA